MGLREEHDSWFIEQTNKSRVNPCVVAYGIGPKDQKCKGCKHLLQRRYSKTYFKCAFRKNTHGPATDHRVNWPACSKFEREMKDEKRSL